jgi:type VI secretion system secreted protein VgrG
MESRNESLDMIAQKVINILSTQSEIRVKGRRIVLEGGGSQLVIDDAGIIGHTNGKYLMHAGDHATADPQARPVDYPVTQDNPGKLAAHHVLVESGGGFAVAGQPYRLTLDDGQIIQGVTSGLGELQMVTSNVAAFGVIELMSQSVPEDVIGVTHVAVYRDAELPPPPAPLVPARRTAQIGGKTASTPEEGATTQGQPARYVTCDPMNFGLRRYRILNGAKADESPGYQSRSNIEYPVTRQYTAAIKPKLLGIDWADLAGKSDDDITAIIAPVVQEAVWTALQDGPFGLPRGRPGGDKPGAMPAMKIIGPENASKYSMKPTYAGGFIASRWVLGVAQFCIQRIIDGMNRQSDYWLMDFAATLYHEARHCQQKYWIVSLLNTYPDDYRKFINIFKYYDATVDKNVYALSSRQPFPKDERVRIEVHRMLVFEYYWSIVNRPDDPFYEFLAGDLEVVQDDVCKIRNVTPEVAQKMAKHNSGYRSHLHEEDAYATEKPVRNYWSRSDYQFLFNPGSCTDDYANTLRAIGAI